jgi:Dual specificity phosphatase, catalytic domain
MEAFINARAAVRNQISIDANLLTRIQNDYSNWVIPGRVMCGPYPGYDNVNFHSYQAALANISAITADGIDAFVCLQEEEPHSNNKPRYADLLPSPSILYFHFPVEDHKVCTPKEFTKHMTTLLELLARGKNIFIHCAGGHGRTGTYVACLLMTLFDFPAKHALYYTQHLHNLRRTKDARSPSAIPCMSPENDVQIEFVQQWGHFLNFLL